MSQPTAIEAPAGRQPAVVTRIAPSHGWLDLRLRQIWDYRDLLYFLVWRDIKVRYKQTVLGAMWAILQPVLTMVVFSIFFGKLAGVKSDALPYPIFVFCGLLPWQLFAYALNESGNSLVTNRALITKVYFPRLIIPIAAVLGGVPDFAIAFLVMVLLMLLYGIFPTGWILLTLPALVVFALITALAVGVWLSALNVEYRDVRYTIPFLTQIWFFATPIAYPSSLLPESVRAIYGINPMAGVVDGFRWALLGGSPPGPLLGVSIITVVVVLVTGLIYFRRMERTFADVI
ncbi:MAG: ABC transporter permease [Verrucomicrobiae bacterium]|nr:ABC transporter permease [Verrucomicrobiae bacterium]